MASKNKSQDMAQSIIDALKDGTAPWVKPWTPDQSAVPHNPVTGTRYKGVNFLYLSMQGKPDPRWVTFKQAQQKGWQVKRGSKGTTVQFWQFEKDVQTKDSEGKTVTEQVKLERPLLRHYYVFNGSDIEGMPELNVDPKVNNEWDRHDRAENILQQSGAEIEHIAGDKAVYRPLQDNITLPEKGQFDTPDKYYATALHELGHWTGHESRLNRNLMNVFGSQDYAREELRAEIASYMVGMQLGIGHDPGQHLAYIDSWIKDLEDHPTEIFKACADAEKIQSYVLEFEQEQAREETMEQQASFFIVTDDSLVAFTKDDRLEGDVYDENTKRFDDPATALQTALEIKNSDRLEDSELHVYRVNPPDDLERDPVLVIDTPHQMRSMWVQNIGGAFPENLVQEEVEEAPDRPVNEVTGKQFVSFFAKQEIDSTGILLELRATVQKGDTGGVLRLESAIEKDLSERSTINMAELNRAGFDGVVFTEKGRAVSAIATDKKHLLPGMYQAAKGLKKVYLNVPYEDKNQAKKYGALWSKPAKSWFIPEGLDKRPFTKWQGQEVTADNPREKFAEFICEMGGDLQGQLPEMDGKFHRIPEVGAKRGNKNISYVGHLDGVPAGYVKNFRGEERRWKLADVMLTDEDRARIKKEGLEKKAQREEERQKLYEQKARESRATTKKLASATGKEEYFTGKGIDIKNPEVKVDSKGNIVVPLFDINGKQWSHQTLQANGFKQLFKDARLEGTFALIGAKSVKDIKGDILVAEGYSTAATIHEVTGQPVVVSTTANNLKHVAGAINKKHPDKAIYIMADDDWHLEKQGKVNAGQVKAKDAAALVGGHVISPGFNIAKPDKTKTDFNDMARVVGKGTVHQYIRAKMELARSGKKIEREKEQKQEQKKERAAVVER